MAWPPEQRHCLALSVMRYEMLGESAAECAPERLGWGRSGMLLRAGWTCGGAGVRGGLSRQRVLVEVEKEVVFMLNLSSLRLAQLGKPWLELSRFQLLPLVVGLHELVEVNSRLSLGVFLRFYVSVGPFWPQGWEGRLEGVTINCH